MSATFGPLAIMDSTSFWANPRSTAICSFSTVTVAVLKPGSCARAWKAKRTKSERVNTESQTKLGESCGCFHGWHTVSQNKYWPRSFDLLARS